MGLKDKRKAAARLSVKAQPENLVPNEVNVAEPNAAITIMVEDSDGYEDGVTSQNSDCGYEGGVNHWSNSDSEGDFNMDNYSDAESLEELEGDELES
jgi:hypothetical protein